MSEQRLDIFLIKNKLCDSRTKAQELIKHNKVTVNNAIVNKTKYLVKDSDLIEIIDDLEFVSRAGNKLKKAFEHFNITPQQMIILDIGASTGGFSDCCLQNGADKIYCLDVGKDQLHNKIKNNSRVVELSNTNIKDINNVMINDVIDLVVSDLSFISSKFMFQNILKINLSKSIKVISLIKPQFELTKDIVDKYKGIVKDEKYHQLAINNVIQFAKECGFKCVDVIESPILGSKGNKEFLGLFVYER